MINYLFLAKGLIVDDGLWRFREQGMWLTFAVHVWNKQNQFNSSLNFFPIRKILILICPMLNKFYSRLVLPTDLLNQNLIA